MHLISLVELPAVSVTRLDRLLDKLLDGSILIGQRILVALIVFIVGRYVVKLLNRLFRHMLERGTIDPGVQSFLRSLVNIILLILLVLSVVGALGINTTSLAALLASAGVAIGMALSGNLQNVAGGIVILLFKPYKVGDYIEAQGNEGTVKEILLFHTIIQTVDLRTIYIPNGQMSTTVVINQSRSEIRRAQWVVSIQYGNNVTHAKEVIQKCLDAEPRLLREPTSEEGKPLDPFFIEVTNLNASSVDLTVCAYVKRVDFLDVRFKMNEAIYAAIDADPTLNIPFPTNTIHIVNKK
ncbi:mechanosensitive ion channel [Alloprevotella tannerae]|uniref:mechanosensitive ion channel family protein n=1 Tax=Alloprevotella tannerae TaxID=76122 RepID=UPI001EDC2E3A|nr:mechanosensitive ion channel domain-containing protein [Alloprevotella tannerae]MCG2651000.1 mechanosensitive ion channel [Alloprevotella tannerae]